MSLDVRTLFIVVGMSCFLVSGALIFLRGRQLRTDGVWEWCVGYAIQGIYWVLLGFRGIIPDFFSIVIANIFLTASYAWLYAAVQKFQHRPIRQDLIIIPVIATILFVSFFGAYMDNFFVRSVFMSLVSGIQMGFIAATLCCKESPQNKRSCRLTASFFAIGSILWFIHLLGVLVLPDQQYRFLEPSPVRMILLIFAFIDVALINIGFLLMIEEKLGEELHESEEIFRKVSGSANDAIIMMNDEGKISLWNEAAETIFGYSRQEAIGKVGHELIAPQRFHEMYENNIREFKNTGQGFALGKLLELAALRRDGTEFPIELSLSSTQIQGRWNAIGLIRDITERKQAEAALHKAFKELQEAKEQLVQSEKIAALGRLASAAAHEIRNPLNTVNRWIQILEKTETLTEETRETFGNMNVQIARIVKIIDGLWTLSSHPTEKKKHKDINQVIDHVLRLASDRIKEENVFIETSLQSDIPMFLMDVKRMEQAFLHMVNNALDAVKNSEVKKVSIRTWMVPVEAGEQWIRISVSDTGHGIREEDLHRIFEPFFTIKEQYNGTGVGLAFVFSTIQDHGGRIRAENNAWGGASFFIELPVGESPSS